MSRPACLALVAALSLVACQQPEAPAYDVETTRVYTEDERAVFDAVVAFLESHDFEVLAADLASGMIHAERRNFEDAGWADCERKMVSDRGSDRRIRANPVDRNLDLRIEIRETDVGTEVRLDPELTEEQINPLINLPLTVPCRSKGVLEAELLNSI